MRKFLLFIMFILLNLFSFSQINFKILSSNCTTNIIGDYDALYAGEIDGSSADWNCPNMYLAENAVQGCLVLINDGASGISITGAPPLNVPNYYLGCDTSAIPFQDLTGKIAIIYRGNCQYSLKAYNAQRRGAIGVIIINHTGEAIGMSGGSLGITITIPTIMIGRTEGDLLVSCLDTVCTGVEGFIGIDLISGSVFQDNNENCLPDTSEILMKNRLALINPGNIIVETNLFGYWSLDSLPVGNYSITIDTTGNWSPFCSATQNFSVDSLGSIVYVPSFGLIYDKLCIAPYISVHMPRMRPCFTNQLIYVQACNLDWTNETLINGFIELELDSLITPTSFSIPFISLGNNTYGFDVGNLNPGQCINFTINTTVSCSAIVGQSLCMQANLYPADSCVFDSIPTPPIGGVEPCTLPWDHSSLSVDGWCQNDSIYFTITNNGVFGNGDMLCYAPVRIYIDGVLTTIDSVLLVGGQTQTYVFASDGKTWRLEADQHPLHPGNSHPNATIELCGNPANWTPNLVNISPPDDADPVVDIYCGVVTGSYDPNDKTGYPLGVGNNHFVAPNGKIDFVIRFQNTGTDTAFTVVVRDTLDVDLDIFSVQSGVSSHDYTFKMFGPRVLEWTFNYIMLPDSTSDLSGSNGFITFSVLQNPDLANGTVINNSASIYFDYNAPIFTNTTSHIINRAINHLVGVKEAKNINNNNLFIYPNPTKNQLNIVLSTFQNLKIEIYAVDGKLIEQKSISKNTSIDVSNYKTGLYFINAINNKGEVYRNKFVKE